MLDVGPGACDTHLHFYDARHPTATTATLFPPDASPDQYRSLQAELGLERLVVVQPTTYGLDNTCQLEAMSVFGSDARGIAVVDASTSNRLIGELHDAGMRGARFHMLPGGAVDWADLATVARRVEAFGWHIQLQMNGRELVERLDQLLDLPTALVVDHIGRFMPPVPTDHPAFEALRRLLAAGRTWVKLSAPYESSADVDATLPAVHALVGEFPERLLWASNWPHPGQADPPTATDLVALSERWLPERRLRRLVLVDNPAHVYGFDTAPQEDP
jgi:D-galactarolactone isomerase